MSLKDFELIKELGKGAFGSVCLVKRIADGNVYAVKRVKISQLNKKEQENSLNEVRILASISHPNIIGYKEAFFDDESKTLNMVMEYADDGDLESKIQKHIKKNTNFSENELWSFLIQMIQGLKSLHDNKIMHRDLKSANVFLMKNGLLKLGDLNVSKVVKMGLVYTQTGTPYYASPEVWADKPYDYKSDIWSVGCVIYELCSLKPPFRGNNLEQLYNCVKKGVYDPIPSIYSKELSKILSLLLFVNPTHRPDCDTLLCHPLVLKRMDFNKNIDYGCQAILLNTIKLPRNINDINQKLPKTKKYEESTGLTIKRISSENSSKFNVVNKPSSGKPLSNNKNRRINGYKIDKNSVDIENLNDSYGIIHTAQNLNRKEINELEDDDDDDFFIDEKVLLKNKNHYNKNKIPPTLEEYQMMIALNNSAGESRHNNIVISNNLNNIKDENKLKKSNINEKCNENRDEENKIKRDNECEKKIYQKIEKNSLDPSRSKTPNQQTNKKENLVNINREGKLIRDIYNPNINSNAKIQKNNLYDSANKNRQELQNQSAYRVIHTNPNEKYKSLMGSNSSNKNYNTNDTNDKNIKINNKEIQKTPINQSKSNPVSLFNSQPNSNYTKLYNNGNPNYKNIYNPNIYTKPTSVNNTESKDKNNINLLEKLNAIDNNNPSRAISARPNKNVGIPITLIQPINSTNSNNKASGKNLNIQISSKRDIENSINRLLQKNNYALHNYNNKNNKILLSDDNRSNYNNIINNPNNNQRPITSRDKNSISNNNYNILSKNNNITNTQPNQHYLISPQINNNHQNISKKEIFNFNEKINFVKPIKLSENNNQKRILNPNNIASEFNLKSNDHTYNIDKNNYLNINMNNVNKPVYINPYRK